MRKRYNNRRLGIESLENRVVFAGEVVMVDVDLLVQWDLVKHDSDFAIENKDKSVSVSIDRLAMISEGQKYLNGISNTPSNSHAIANFTEKSASMSSILDSAVTIHETFGTPSHSADTGVATHLGRETSHQKSNDLTMESELLDSPSLLTFGPSSTDPIDAANEEGSTRFLLRDLVSPIGSDVQVLDQLAQIQTSRPFESTALVTKPNQIKDSSEFVKPLDESFASWGIRPSSGELRSLRGSSEPRFEIRQGTDLLEDRSWELFAETFSTTSLPDAKTDPAAHSWSLLFGVVQPASNSFADAADPELAGVRRAVLEILAESERSDLRGAEIPTMYSSNGWKATSILAAAVAAVFYRNNRQPDDVTSLLARFRKQRLSSSRPRRRY